MPRILSVWSPSWAIDTWRRRRGCASPAEASPPAAGRPFALIASERGVRRLFALDRAAGAAGLFPGQKATDATALVPELVVEEADPEGDRAALGALALWCVRFSPAVAVDPPAGLFLDITGVARLWSGEAAMLADLLDRLAQQGIAARGAVAGSAGAAWALARFGAEDRICAAPGAEGALLTGLPMAALRLPPADAAQLARLGLCRIGQLEALPRPQLARRFGEAVLRRLDQALGRAEEALVFERPPTPWFARLAFAEPISSPEDLGRAMRDIAGRLCARLAAAGRGAGCFDLAFHRLDGRAERMEIGLCLPGRDEGVLARLFAPMLERVDPGFGIEVVTLSADEVEPLAQRQLVIDALAGGGEGGPMAEAVAPLIDRLSNRLGEDRVWRDEAQPSHVPERAISRRPPFAAHAQARGGDPAWPAGRPRPVRLLGRPEPIEAAAPVPDDPPIFFRWRGAMRRVRRAEGPERIAEEWWRRPPGESQPGHVRDYYRVEDETGARYWIFRAGLYDGPHPPRWWLHGLG